jgi:hypothetical protein
MVGNRESMKKPNEKLIRELRMKTFSTRDLPTARMKEPWPDKYVDWTAEISPAVFEAFERTLNGAEHERPLQVFLAKHPYLLALAFPVHTCWLFPKPRLAGGMFIPDFALCDKNSLGYKWRLIELESPRMRATNDDGSVSRDCHHAVQQILDYRHSVRENALFEENQGFKGLNAECEGVVVIGRRDDARTDVEMRRLADFRQQRIEIASYDRLRIHARDHYASLHRKDEILERFKTARKKKEASSVQREQKPR